MASHVALETAGRGLREALEALAPGETLRLVDEEGEPVAVIVSVRPHPVTKRGARDWRTRLDALGQRVSRQWQSEKSAVEIVSEMRR